MSKIKPRTVYLLKRTDKSDDGTDICVGSTSQTLTKRLIAHRVQAQVINNKLYTRMCKIGLYNWQIIPLLTFACDKKTIREFEKSWVEVLNTDLNTYSPLSDSYMKRYRQADRELYHSNIQNKAYYCDICDKAFGYRFNLRKHFNTLKHQYAYLNSVD